MAISKLYSQAAAAPVSVSHVREITKWNEENILYPNKALPLERYAIPTLRQCLFCFIRYANHPDPARLKDLIKASLGADKHGLEFLLGLLWQMNISKNSAAKVRAHETAVKLLNDDLQLTYKAQLAFIDTLRELYEKVRNERKANRTGLLQRTLFTEPYLLFEPLLLPIEGLPCVDGIIPEQSHVFSSTQSPLLLTFRTTEGTSVRCIFKEGDDVRQDHMTIQIIRFMDAVLQEANVDLDILTYDVTATSKNGGLIQCLDAQPISSILAAGTLEDYLIAGVHSSDELAEKKTRFVKSLCGYTLFTYLLCIGDRHLDNILLSRSGHLVHIDFSFLGREPKPFAPEVKLAPQFIDLLGGKSSGYYQLLVNLSIKAYKCLRKSKGVILDYIHSFCIHGVADVNVHLLPCIDSRFNSHLGDAEATQEYVEAMERGFESVMPRIMDKIHAIVT